MVTCSAREVAESYFLNHKGEQAEREEGGREEKHRERNTERQRAKEEGREGEKEGGRQGGGRKEKTGPSLGFGNPKPTNSGTFSNNVTLSSRSDVLIFPNTPSTME